MGNFRHYRRKLPHFHTSDVPIFVTFRLHDSIPMPKLRQLQEMKTLLERNLMAQQDVDLVARQAGLYRIYKKHFQDFDNFLDKGLNEPFWLRTPELASMVCGAIHFQETAGKINLQAFCVMPNHVHLLFTPIGGCSVETVVHSIKSYTAHEINKHLNRSGKVWADESFDHIVREGELERIVMYILENPVKAGLVAQWQDWRWSYSNNTER